MTAEPILLPAYPYDEAQEPSLFAKFEPGTRILPAGYQTMPHFRATPVDIVFEKDIAVTMRDGTTIYLDVMRPAGDEKVPVIVAWSPYGKGAGTHPKYSALYSLLGVDVSDLSGLGKFEGPDPAYWCAKGYAICNPDARGVYECGGDGVMCGKQDGEDSHDVIEWLATQDWCNGKVGMSGNSYLAISQWFAAAEQPPHLAAIAPWEGMSDLYRDLVRRGGIPDLGFPKQWEINWKGANRREDLVAEGEQYPLVNEVWESKIAQFERVTVPAYIVASYSNSIHTPGTFRGWRRISSADKWLRVHNTMEWPDALEEANIEDLRRFFDHYLKGEANGWENTARVRYAVQDLEGGDRLNVEATAFPPDDVSYVRYYLDGASAALTADAPKNPVTVSYDAVSEPNGVSFVVRFDTETELVGYPKADLWVEADGSDDMDLFVLLQKLNADEDVLEQFTVPNHGPVMQSITANGASILKYKGSNGRLRVSLRHLDGALSTDEVPVHTFDRVDKLAAGDVVPVEIDMFPIGLAVHPSEYLRLTISGHNVLGGVMPNVPNLTPDNHGKHVIHTGGSRAAYLQLPVKPR